MNPSKNTRGARQPKVFCQPVVPDAHVTRRMTSPWNLLLEQFSFAHSATMLLIIAQRKTTGITSQAMLWIQTHRVLPSLQVLAYSRLQLFGTNSFHTFICRLLSRISKPATELPPGTFSHRWLLHELQRWSLGGGTLSAVTLVWWHDSCLVRLHDSCLVWWHDSCLVWWHDSYLV